MSSLGIMTVILPRKMDELSAISSGGEATSEKKRHGPPRDACDLLHVIRIGIKLATA